MNECLLLDRAYPIDDYPAKCKQAAAVMHMIMNNLDPRVAQFPQELVTYGGNGQVFSNWAQVRLHQNRYYRFSRTFIPVEIVYSQIV
jgi:urocanate hydratase